MCVSDMSSFISLASWDGGVGGGGCRCESHVVTNLCFFVRNRALVCLLGFEFAADVIMSLSTAGQVV